MKATIKICEKCGHAHIDDVCPVCGHYNKPVNN